MILRRPSGGDTTGEERLLLLPRRSLLIMSGESRYAWQHGITARKADPLPDGTMMERARRVSITFRKVAINDEVPLSLSLLDFEGNA